MAKTMRKWRLYGYVAVDVSVSVTAETVDEAIDLAESRVVVTEYCNGTVGVDYWNDEIEDSDISCSDNISWNENYCELEEEWEEEDEEEEEDEDETE